MTRGYAQATDISTYLGLTFTAPQTAQATTYIGMAEAYIDRATNRSWIVSAITDEYYPLTIPRLSLKSAPVTSVTSVKYRTTTVGDTSLTLTAGTDYELEDAQRGILQLLNGYAGPRNYALVSYVPSRPVPADISLATIQIVAATMSPGLYPDRSGVKSVQVDRDTRIEYSSEPLTLKIPPMAQGIIDRYRLPVMA